MRTILDRLGPGGPLDLSQVVEQFREKFFTTLKPGDLEAALEQADVLLDECDLLKVAVHPFGWSSYPSQLARLTDPPAFLFSLGCFDAYRRPRVAVIGTRKPTRWGLDTARACAAQIADAHGVVVSGLALGIDAAAHTASVARHSPTWAVMAHGLHMASPSSNRDLAKRILEEGGAWISEYAPGEAAQRHYFVERDRIQAGLSDAVLVIESGIDGGAMHTVRAAEQAHVPVWTTIPNAMLSGSTAEIETLPEPQQGPWMLVETKRASRVASLRMLDQMLGSLVAQPARTPTGLFAG